ncbi:hypothetical protein H4Q26_009878 [Puccinia striiformis f. sp. tritici PST-130]|nr:hypothetical protein H4Q26_009878 [Puccinia striiformis f. sp. tritici PST-130]
MPPPPTPHNGNSTNPRLTALKQSSTSITPPTLQHLWPKADPNLEKFELSKPRDELAEQVVMRSLPASAQQGMLAFSTDKKWTLIYNDRYTGRSSNTF